MNGTELVSQTIREASHTRKDNYTMSKDSARQAGGRNSRDRCHRQTTMTWTWITCVCEPVCVCTRALRTSNGLVVCSVYYYCHTQENYMEDTNQNKSNQIGSRNKENWTQKRKEHRPSWKEVTKLGTTTARVGDKTPELWVKCAHPFVHTLAHQPQ